MAAAHTTDQRAFIVRGLAAYLSPSVIVAAFEAQWRDTACSLADVLACEPVHLDASWRAYFDTERAAFLEAPTADKRVRVAELHRMYVQTRDRGAIDLAAKLLDQIRTEQEDAPATAAEQVTAIRRTVVDPVAPA